MKKILILGSSNVQNDFVLELKKYKDFEIHCVARDKGVAFLNADKYEYIDFSDLEKLEIYIKENNIDYVYSVGSDLGMKVSSIMSEKLGLKSFIDSNISDICTDKNKLREALKDLSFGSVNHQILSSIDDKVLLRYPYIMKPSESQGQRGISIVTNDREFEESYLKAVKYTRNNKVIIEDYVLGKEYSVNAFLVDSKIEFILTSLRETWSDFFGLIHKHVVDKNLLSEQVKEKVYKLIDNSAKKIGIKNGPVYAQIKIVNDKPYMIEITPRMDGCHMQKLIKYSLGVDFFTLIIDSLLYDKYPSKIEYEDMKNMTLEFICQKPRTKAYNIRPSKNNIIDSDFYYEKGDIIREINNRYEKIGYIIYEDI